MSFKALDTAERLWRLLLDYRYAQEKDPKWEQMIYLWRGLTLKQFLENEWNERIGQPLDINHILRPNSIFIQTVK